MCKVHLPMCCGILLGCSLLLLLLLLKASCHSSTHWFYILKISETTVEKNKWMMSVAG